MLVDVGDGPLRHVRIASLAAALGGKEQEFGEDVGQIFGEQGLPDHASVIEGFQDGGHFPKDRIAVREGEDISQPGNDIFIVRPCGDAVEVAPQAFPSGLGGVGMSFIAVDQDELAGPDVEGAALKGQIQFPFLDIHQKKAVEGFPGEGVSRQVGK